VSGWNKTVVRGQNTPDKWNKGFCNTWDQFDI